MIFFLLFLPVIEANIKLPWLTAFKLLSSPFCLSFFNFWFCLGERDGVELLNRLNDHMAEICYDNESVMTKTTATTTMMKKTTSTTRRRERSSSQAARRRRMEIRRFRFVSGEQDPNFVDGELQKRKRRDSSSASAVFYERTKDVVVLCESLSSTVMTLPDPEAYLNHGVASVCGRRREMEDAVAVHPFFFRQQTELSSSAFHYCGVYDGHGCSHVAMRCRERLHELVREEFEADANADWEKSLARSFTRMDMEVVALNDGSSAKCRCELQRPDCDAVGSTAVVSILTPDKIIVANCGDSRAVLCRNGKPIPLSSDHKPDRPDELDRIQAAGGRVIYWDGPRVLGVLAMSRAIGDNYLKPYVISKPEVTVTDRVNEDDFLILASDGLWDVVSNETACSVVRMCLRRKLNGKLTEKELKDAGAGNVVVGEGEVSDKACEEASVLLTRLALARQSSDNVSVVVVDLRRDT